MSALGWIGAISGLLCQRTKSSRFYGSTGYGPARVLEGGGGLHREENAGEDNFVWGVTGFEPAGAILGDYAGRVREFAQGELTLRMFLRRLM
jgi:hypothetical protein